MPLNAPPPIYVHPAQVPKYVTVIFPSGQRHQTDTCEEMEDFIRQSYAAFEFYWDSQHFRECLARRIAERTWGEIEIDTDGTSRDFLQEMERAGLFSLGLHYE
jgi:hypothetical protein